VLAPAADVKRYRGSAFGRVTMNAERLLGVGQRQAAHRSPLPEAVVGLEARGSGRDTIGHKQRIASDCFPAGPTLRMLHPVVSLAVGGRSADATQLDASRAGRRGRTPARSPDVAVQRLSGCRACQLEFSTRKRNLSRRPLACPTADATSASTGVDDYQETCGLAGAPSESSVNTKGASSTRGASSRGNYASAERVQRAVRRSAPKPKESQ